MHEISEDIVQLRFFSITLRYFNVQTYFMDSQTKREPEHSRMSPDSGIWDLEERPWQRVRFAAIRRRAAGVLEDVDPRGLQLIDTVLLQN